MAQQEIKSQDVLDRLKEFQDPETGRSVVDMGQVKDVKVSSGKVDISLGLTSFAAPLWEKTLNDARALLSSAFPETEFHVHRVDHQRPPDKIGEIGLTAKSVIAVGSGKGGVGKSTVAAALAYGLHRAGSHVGLMDADVYGPSIPHLLGVQGRPEVVDNKIQPLEADGLRMISMGLLTPPNEAVIWRGPMLHGAITQFLRDTAWGELDYLIIDMPPGTGDIALTLSQLLPLSGAVVVCTPQEVALLDAVKAIAMFRKVSIPVLGMVENMSGFICPDCNKRYDIFGHGGAKQKAEELDVTFLGDIPINMAIRAHGDAGKVSGIFDDETTRDYLQRIIVRLAENMSQQAKEDPPLPSLNVL